MYNILNNFDELVEEFRIDFTLCSILEHEMSLVFLSSITTHVFYSSCVIGYSQLSKIIPETYQRHTLQRE